MKIAAPPLSDPDFYAAIPSFSNFNELIRAEHFRRVPGDWWVVLTDVKGSTQAIQAGRYKDVNRIGAAAIVCAQKALGGADFPYVFGGDGATFVLPAQVVEPVTRALAVLKGHSERRFKLGLRVGAVPVHEVEAMGASIEVGRFELAAGRCIAVFRGGGLVAAEKLIKGDETKWGLEARWEGAPDLDDLSCRWNPVPAERGTALAVLVQARGDDPYRIYGDVLLRFEQILGRRLEQVNPIRRSAMRYRSWWACVRDEVRHFPSAFSAAFLKKLVGISVAVLSLKWGLHPGFYDPVAYAVSVPAHSDYRKFDDALRLVIDCSPDEVEQLRAYLESERKAGRLCYGLHASKAALLTCYVRGTDPGEHVHFVDGGDGGYAVAAKELKAQLKAL
jgi:hypothetical protein